ncbi:hypothetical protein [Sphaerisporangium fuscum]|uniref:hypothetical protein n=1 Tax=Sphaerisporangium fuscum TaxID=2835868 RepID=UPI001BDC365D|nr:hypothetical protein [Sphaerisporangium fuscum]
MDLSAAANELYGLPPEDFVEARKRLAAEAKKAGQAELSKQVGALRKPTLPAWAVNRLARSEPGDVGRLLDLGEELRTAWTSGGRVGELDQRRGELVGALVRRAQALAEEEGRPLREPAVREVEDTLHAATMDPDVAEEVRAGRLTQPRSYAGFFPAGDLSGAFSPAAHPVAGPARPAAAKREPAAKGPGAKETEARKQEAEARRRREEEERRRRLAQQAEAAAAEAREAENALAEWEAEVAEAERARDAVVEEAERLRRELDAVLDRQEGLTKRLGVAERERNRAARRAADARSRAAEAREKL